MQGKPWLLGLLAEYRGFLVVRCMVFAMTDAKLWEWFCDIVWCDVSDSS